MMRRKATLSDKRSWQVARFVFLITLAWQSTVIARTRDELFGPGSTNFWSSLDNRVSLLRRKVPLRDAVQRFGDSNRLSIFVDRRLDPSSPVDMIAENKTVREVLDEFAAANGWAVSYLPPIVYLGPPETTTELATSLYRQHQIVQEMPLKRRRALTTQSPRAWERLTEPRKLVSQWAAQHQLEITGTEQIPHDLWDAFQLPKTDIVSALSIVLAGFDLGVQVESTGEMQIAPLSKNQSFQRDYRIPNTRRQELSSWLGRADTAKVKVRRNQAIVDGSLEQHRMFFDWLNRDRIQRPSHRQATRKRFTLAVQNEPFEVVLSSVAKQLELDLVWRLNNPEIRQTRVSVSVTDGTLGDLLSAICDPVGADYLRQPSTIIITNGSLRTND